MHLFGREKLKFILLCQLACWAYLKVKKILTSTGGGPEGL